MIGGGYQAYPEYRDSGVEWIQEIPEHWDGAKLRWIGRIYSGGTPSKKIEGYWKNGTIPWLNSGAVNQNKIGVASTYITEIALKNSSAKWIPEGALLVALAGQGKTKGMVAQLAMKATCNQSMAAICPTIKINERYLYWWLKSNYQNIRNMAGGDLRDGLNLDLLGDIGCPLPTDVEKQKISDFLDHETQKIDTLIEKQQQLIKLLKEKRQAVISHAVTKGLNPDVPMKDSGVEWLGDVPEHWDVVRSKVLFKERLGRSIAGSEELLTVSHITGVTKRSEKDVNMIMADSLVGYKICEKNDLVINTMWAWMGAMGCSFQNGIVSPSYNIYQILDQQRLNARFIDLLVRTPEFISIATSHSKGIWSSRLRLYPEPFFNIKFAIPPYREQIDIKNHIEFQTGLFSKIIDKCKNSIGLLMERRTALISAAVTGKIDVRNWQPPKQSNQSDQAPATKENPS